jgi:hypothetical protein
VFSAERWLKLIFMGVRRLVYGGREFLSNETIWIFREASMLSCMKLTFLLVEFR